MNSILKKILKRIPFNFTKNQIYDSQTKKIIKKYCNSNSRCLDVGCHEGEVMDEFLKIAPNTNHLGFEPIPILFNNLQKKYANTSVTIYNIALSNKIEERTKFNYVKTNPAYSGLIKRKYDNANEIDIEIEVSSTTLDSILPVDSKIDLIKIDVEGGELLVLEGALQTIKKNKPIIIFEHGLGASEFYDSTPEKVFSLLSNCDLKISTMEMFLLNGNHLSLDEFCSQFYNKINYYFVAFSTNHRIIVR